MFLPLISGLLYGHTWITSKLVWRLYSQNETKEHKLADASQRMLVILSFPEFGLMGKTGGDTCEDQMSPMVLYDNITTMYRNVFLCTHANIHERKFMSHPPYMTAVKGVGMHAPMSNTIHDHLESVSVVRLQY